MNGSNSYQVVVCNAGGKPILLTSIMLKAGLPVSFVANPGPSNDGSEFSCRVGDLEMFSNNYIRNGSRGFLVPGKPPFPNIEELDIDGQDNYVHTPQQAAISCLLSNLIIAPDRVSVSIKKQSIDNSWNDEGAAGFLGIATWIYEVGLGTLKVELEVEEIPIHAEFIVSHVPGGHGPALHLSKLSVAGLDCDSLGRNKAKWLESELGKQLLQMSDVGIQLKALAQGCYEQNHFRVERYETAGAKLHEKLQELCSQNGSELIEKAKREVGGFSEYCEYRRLETLPVGAWMLSDKEVALATVVNQSNEPALGHEYGHVTREDSGAYQYRPAKKVTEYSYVGPLAFVVGDRRGDYAVQATFSDRLEGMRTVDWGAPEGAPYWASDVDVFTCSFLGSIRATLRVSSVQYLEGEKLFGEPKAVEEFQAKKRALYEQTKKTDLPSVALAMAIKALVIEEPPLEPILDTVRRSILLGTTNFAPIFKRLVGNEWAQTVCKKMDDALRIANQFGTP